MMAGSPNPRQAVAVVTGASGGIGRAVARAVSCDFSHLVVHYFSRRDAIAETEAELTQTGRSVHVLQADLSNLSQCRHLVDIAWQWQQRIDAWLHIAGADVLTGPAADWDFHAKLERLWQVDVRGTIECCREIGRRMQTLRGPTRPAIVTLGWDQADQGMEGDSGEMFAAVKAAVAAFSRSLAQSLAPRVRVNCVSPGWIQTDWSRTASDKWHRRAAQQSLTRRWGTPDDVAQVVRFLASPDSDFLNGQVVHVNGGFCYYPGERGEG